MLKKRAVFFHICLILLLGGISPAPVPASTSSSITISDDNINIREGPGLSYKAIARVHKGNTYPLLKEQGDWIEIDLLNGQKGWVAKWLVAKNQSASSSAGESIQKNNGTATTDGLRVRKGPGAGFQVIGSLNKGQAVAILESNENWLKVQTAFGQGWVAKEYIRFQKTNPTENEKPDTPETNIGKISVDSLNVRNTPSFQGSILGKLQRGEEVTVLSQNGDWTEIKFSGKTAWVNSQYVLVEQKDSQEASTSGASANLVGVEGTVTATTLYVHEKGNLNSKIIGSVSKGENFQIYEEVNNWAKIEWKTGKYGWVANWFLNKTEAGGTKPDEERVRNSTITILQNGTNLRKGPSVETEVVYRANQGETFQVVSLQNDWYKIRLQNGTTAFVAGWIVSVKGNAPQVVKPGAEINLKNKTIVLDPGHGGRDHGTTGTRGTMEKQLTLRTAKLLFDKLKASGANVILTRNDDTFISLSSRVRTAKYQNADAFISIHYNSNSDHSIHGITSYYYYPFQKPLAESVHSATISQTKMKDRGVRFGDYYVIRETNKNAILLELGYLSNSAEEMLVTSGQYQESVSSGIFQGLAKYFTH
ncbi:SH3 domain-containing protein [Bacillus methanolicus]|uniref:N-acetylmuramoyl-L-alanine amidase, family 3 n=1 Tax=Bacillus methanolicus (strain MGA3 / ATCC 53907) TaxID=796606 RepID=I3EAV0_BACMM|nr:SH3 domain-containing protein [Bacillus methanolicus]AIE60857.1 N-acetylmuramoyl-L-alanine amidase, family 3 [Bacillus methanolicus MGA3]EIJ83621.1 YrvJ [Bacillus methanolicus MGA3]